MGTVSKSLVLETCIDKAAIQIQELESAMAKVKESIVSEEKSSVGDKFETSRAMAQKEMELLSQQMDKAQSDYAVLQQIDPNAQSFHVQLGSLVQTKSKLLFIAVAMGRVAIGGKDIFVVSPTSPIAQAIIGQEKGFHFQVGPNADSITSIS